MSVKVLIFDSGVGGLSILNELQQRYPLLEYHYLFDNAYFPYGELAEPALIERVTYLLTTASLRINPQLIVVACNSASTLALPALRKQIAIPLVGVVPAIKTAAKLSDTRQLGLLATPGTVQRNYTQQLINEFAPNCKVELIGSTSLVEQAESKLRGRPVDLALLAKELAPWQSLPIDTVVLGCTHFPLIKDEIQQVLGKQIRLVDSGVAIARRVGSLLVEGNEIKGAKKEPLPAYAYGTANSGSCLLKAFTDYRVKTIKLFA